ncbi:gamma-glutamyltransferase family protein [Limnohabitans sp. Rim8]|uniref:gamma-glutamyltransferase family protein n=1 Tax=Limnohabitans sp. Rim8 TaxID=1100718 RepID=UPI00263894BD|nr:gamma-glutamyltransferase family protein [Limnohabitans sp. Rim8]
MHKILSLITLTLLAACTPTLPTRMPVQPEMASEITDKPGWAYARQAVAAANPLATQAGHQILRAGGSAVDAAIAAQMVLGLVEPQSSGIGGGAFLMYFDGQQVSAHDGRETAPAGADPRLFLDLQGKPLPFNDAVLSGRSVGVPGAVRMLEAAHRQHGVLPWARLFEQAIDLAEQGFQISPRLNTLLQADPHLRKDPLALRFFYDAQGQARPVGQVLRNPEYAHVLRLIAKQGSRALLEGPVAQAIVARTAMPPHPGSLSLQDLSNYQSRDRQALCFDHTALARTYQLCGFPPPSSGHIAIGQILGLLGNTTPQGSEYANGLPSPDYVHRYTQASQLAFADRAQYVADPDFVSAPAGDWRSLLAPDYLRERSQMIGSQSIREAQPGQPGGYKSSYAPMPKQTEYGTSHISVVDAKGRVVAMTSTIEAAFGSRRMVTTDASRPGGFLLNNQLTDFSFAPTDAQGLPIANRVEPGKRPRSAMSPTLVFDKASGQVLMTGGSPGGALIIHYTAKLLVGTLHWQLNTQEAINLPNFASLNGPTLLETKRFPALTVNMLKARGHDVLEIDMTSGLQAIQKTSQGWFGGADPRKEGIVLGD